MNDKDDCPDIQRLEQLLSDATAEAEQNELAAHLETCVACRKRLEELAGAVELPAEDLDPSGTFSPRLRKLVENLTLPPTKTTVFNEPHEPEPSIDFLDPPQQPDQLGRLGEYEITEVIGHGGMGIVLKGHDPRLNRFVAIKVLSPQLASNVSARQRFLREAQKMAAVTHDHVVAIHAIDEAKGLPFIVMEYIMGVSLEGRIDAGGSLRVEEILRIGMQAASGLTAAHAQGLVHRDIKPSNILLENGVERVKITDFGLARAADDAQITQTGVVTGTPQYMSPEQARGEPVDQRSDLFSLGCVLYAMCTGRSPFRASTVVDAIRRVCDDTPRPVQEVNRDIPDWLVAIIERLLAKDPGERFQTAEEVAELLGGHLAHLQQPSVVARPAEPKAISQKPASFRKGQRLLPWAMAAVVTLVLVGIGLGINGNHRKGEREPPESLPKNPALEFRRKGDCVMLPFGYDGVHPITLEAYVVPLSNNPGNMPEIRHTNGTPGVVVGNFAGSGGGLMVSETGYSATLHDDDQYRGVESTQFPFFRAPIHLALVFDNSMLRLFVDGKLASESSFSSESKPSSLSFMIGADPDQKLVTSWEFKGVVDEVRISNVARYLEDFEPAIRFESDADTMGLYHFDNGSGQVAEDSSGNGRDGQIRGASWVDMNRLPADDYPIIERTPPPEPPEGINLLTLADTQRDSMTPLYGNWRFERGELTVSGVWPFLQIPYLLPEEYLFTLTVERISVDKPFGIALNLGGKLCFLRFDSRSGAQCQSGLVTWNEGSPEYLGETAHEQFLKCGEPVTIHCRVGGADRQRSVEVACNERNVFRWEGDIEEISGQVPPYFSAKDARALALCGFGGTFRIADVRLQTISGKGQPVFSGATASVHRQVAEQVLWAGGTVDVSDEQGETLRVKSMEALPEAPELRKIDLRRISAVVDVDLDGVAQIDTLESLVLRGRHALPGDALRQLIQNPGLAEIDLANTSITDEDLDILSNTPQLKSLDLSFTSIRNASLSRIKTCQSLRILALVATHVGDEGAKQLADLARLEDLNLSGTNITDDGVAYLAELSTLKHLTLDHLSISDAALRHLNGLSELTYLSLMHTGISDQSLEALKELKNLENVCLVGTAVTTEGVANLQQALPQCKIQHEASPPIDLLSLVDPRQHSLRGGWTIQQDAVVSVAAQKGKNACLQIPYSPSGDYVLEAMVQRESGDDCVSFGLLVAGHQTSVAIDTYAHKGCITGLCLLDGGSTSENETGVKGRVLSAGANPVRVVITVRGTHVTMACGNDVLIDWEGDSSRLSTYSAHAIADKNQLFLVVYRGATRISGLKLTPISTVDETEAPQRP